jgi:RHH-type proline utilization regulon transcriptional repressor/proline dehydrogenase/delta 1-pyrroline-5-carboxylate dehydrogenase
MGLRVRVYAPVGELVPGMGYLVRRLLENTSNESFVRHQFAEGLALEDLVAAPATEETEIPGPDEIVEISPATDPDTPGAFTNEPQAELRRAPPRARLADAVRAALVAPVIAAPVLVDGHAIAGTRELVSVDPARPGRVVCRSGAATTADADAAIDASLRAWPEWRETPWHARAAVLFRAAAILRRRRAELAALEVLEAGKPIPEADADVCEAIDFCEYYGRAAQRLAAGATVDQAPGERYTASLVTGNAVLFKPAEQTPGVALRLVEALYEAGIPRGVLAFLPGIGEEVGAHAVGHPDVAYVVFTGSKAVGLEIVERAAAYRDGQRQVKRVIAEMGGKNAIVVDADADLDVAVPAIVHSAFAYAGQKCSAASRVIAVAPIFEELVERLVGATRTITIGYPDELGTLCGPLIDAEAQARVRAYRALAHEEGDVVLERDDHPDDGWFVGPTVVVLEDPHARVATEEIFGPLLTVLRANDWNHAIALANDTEYALTAGIFSRSPSRITHGVHAMRAGNIYVNRGITGAIVGRQPFGGSGLSGVGSKAGGPDYLMQFVEPRSVTENTVRQGFAP